MKTAKVPICEECDEELHRYTDPNTGRGGWSCDLCGWSWDDEAEAQKQPQKPAQPDWSTVGPELLEALKIAVREIDEHSCEYHYATEQSVLDKLYAAIARAEGRE